MANSCRDNLSIDINNCGCPNQEERCCHSKPDINPYGCCCGCCGCGNAIAGPSAGTYIAADFDKCVSCGNVCGTYQCGEENDNDSGRETNCEGIHCFRNQYQGDDIRYRWCCDNSGMCCMYPCQCRNPFWPEFTHPRWLCCKNLYSGNGCNGCCR